jgi:ribonucleoside-diphosphate reductase beta chain
MNKWLLSDQVQVAPQEVEVGSYLVGQIDSTVSSKSLKKFADL